MLNSRSVRTTRGTPSVAPSFDSRMSPRRGFARRLKFAWSEAEMYLRSSNDISGLLVRFLTVTKGIPLTTYAGVLCGPSTMREQSWSSVAQVQWSGILGSSRVSGISGGRPLPRYGLAASRAPRWCSISRRGPIPSLHGYDASPYGRSRQDQESTAAVPGHASASSPSDLHWLERRSHPSGPPSRACLSARSAAPTMQFSTHPSSRRADVVLSPIRRTKPRDHRRGPRSDVGPRWVGEARSARRPFAV